MVSCNCTKSFGAGIVSRLREELGQLQEIEQSVKDKGSLPLGAEIPLQAFQTPVTLTHFPIPVTGVPCQSKG